MGIYDDLLKPKQGLYSDLLEPAKSEPEQQQTEDLNNAESAVVKDTAIGLTKGTIGLVSAPVRAGLLVSDAVAEAGQRMSSAITGAPPPADQSYLPSKKLDTIVDGLGKAADFVGVPQALRPTQWEPMLDEAYSDKAKQAQLNVAKKSEAAEQAAAEEGAGFFGKVGAGIKGAAAGIADDPYALIPFISENVPQIFGMAKMVKATMTPFIDDVSAKVAAGTLTKDAADALIKKQALKHSAILEGAITTGQIEKEITSTDKDADVLHRLASIPAGILSAGISRATGFIPGLGDVEAKLATREAVKATDSRLVAGLKGLTTEGLLQEPWQEGQEQIWSNVGTGKDLASGVGQGVVLGALTGGPMGAVGGAMTGGQSQEKEQEKILKGTLDRINSANLSPAELIALRESPKALDRIGITPNHIDDMLKQHSAQSIEVAAFERLVKNAPSEAAKAGLLATERGKAYQKIVAQVEKNKEPAPPKSMELDAAIEKVQTRQAELASKIDLTKEEATELKALNKAKPDDPGSIAKALGVTVKLPSKVDEAELETATQGVKNLDAFKQRETLLEQWQDLQSVNINELPVDQKEQHKADLAAVADEVNALNAQIKQSAQYKTWNELLVKARESAVSPTTSKTPTPALKTEETTAQSKTIPTATPVESAPTETVSAKISPIESEVKTTPATEVTPEVKTAPATEVTPEVKTAPATEVAPVPETKMDSSIEDRRRKIMADQKVGYNRAAQIQQQEDLQTTTEVTPEAKTAPVVEENKAQAQGAQQATQETPVIVPSEEVSNAKSAKSITVAALQNKTKKRKDLLNAKVKTGKATPDQIAELRQLNEAKDDVNTLAKHFGVSIAEAKQKGKKAVEPIVEEEQEVSADILEEQKIKEGIKSDKAATKLLKKYNKDTAPAKTIGQRMKEEADKVKRLAEAKKKAAEAEKRVVESIPEDKRAEYAALTTKEADYRKQAIDAARKGDTVLAHTYQALGKQAKADIDNFRSVHSSLYKNKTEANTSDQADSKSVQNESVRTLNKDEVKLLSDIDGNLQKNGAFDKQGPETPQGAIKASKASRIRDFEKETYEPITPYNKVWFDNFENLINKLDANSPEKFNKEYRIKASLDHMAIVSQIYLDNREIIRLDPKALTDRDQQAAGIQGLDLDHVADTINTARSNALESAVDYFGADENARLYTVIDAALIISALAKYNFWFDNETQTAKYSKITPRTMTTGSLFSGAIAMAAVRNLEDGLNPRDAYKAAIEQVMANKKGVYESAGVPLNGWHKFEQSEYSEDAQRLASIAATSPAQWCTGHGAAGHHLEGGDFYIYSENGVAKIAIRMEDDEIAEVSGSQPGQHLSEEEIEEALRFTKENDISGYQIHDIAADQKNVRLMRAWFEAGGVGPIDFDISIHVSGAYNTGNDEYTYYSVDRRHYRYDNVHLMGKDGTAFDAMLGAVARKKEVVRGSGGSLEIDFAHSSIHKIKISNVDGIFRFPAITTVGNLDIGRGATAIFNYLTVAKDLFAKGEIVAPRLEKANHLMLERSAYVFDSLKEIGSLTADYGAFVKAPKLTKLSIVEGDGSVALLSAYRGATIRFENLVESDEAIRLIVHDNGLIELPSFEGDVQQLTVSEKGLVQCPKVQSIGNLRISDNGHIDFKEDFESLKTVKDLTILNSSSAYFENLELISQDLTVSHSSLNAPSLKDVKGYFLGHKFVYATFIAKNLETITDDIVIVGSFDFKAPKLTILPGRVEFQATTLASKYSKHGIIKEAEPMFKDTGITHIADLIVSGAYAFPTIKTLRSLTVNNGEVELPSLAKIDAVPITYNNSKITTGDYKVPTRTFYDSTLLGSEKVRRGEPAETIQNIESSLAKVLGKDWEALKALGEAQHPGGVTIRQTVAEALAFLGASPDDVQYFSMDGVSAQAFHNSNTGVSVIVADNTLAEMAYGVLVHEVGVHGNQNAALDQQAVDLIEQHKDTAFMKGVLARLKDASLLEDGKPTDPEEARAYLVEEAINAIGVEQTDSTFWSKARWLLPKGVVDFLQNFVSRIKQAFVNRGLLEPFVFTVADLVTIAKSKVTVKTKTQGTGVKESLIGRSADLSEEARSRLAQAIIMAKQEYSRIDILEATGWWEFIPGEWTHELDDSAASISDKANKVFLGSVLNQKHEFFLEDLYDHPALYHFYPELRKVSVDVTKTFDASINGASGAYNPEDKSIEIHWAYIYDIKPVLVHEIQHWIQDQEESVIGGSPESDLIKDVYMQIAMQRLSAMAELAAIVGESDSFNKFLQNLGSIKESRANEALEVYVKQYEALLKDEHRRHPGVKSWLDVAKTPLLSKYELYQRLAGESQARLASYRLDHPDKSIEDAFVDMLYEEGIIGREYLWDERLDYRDALILAIHPNNTTAGSLGEALSLTADGRSKQHVYAKTGWFENEDGVITNDGRSPNIEGAIKASVVKSPVKKQKLSKDDKAAIKVLERIYDAKGKSLDTAIAEAAEDLASTPSNPLAKWFYNLTKNNYGTTKLTAAKQTSNWFDRVFSSPEYYFSKLTATREMLQAAIDDSDIQYQALERIQGGFLDIANKLRKSNPKMYTAAGDYLVDTDRKGIGFKLKKQATGWTVHDRADKEIGSFENEQEAIESMLMAEQRWLATRLVAPQVREFILAARRLTNRAFDILVEDMRKQIARNADEGIPEPVSIYIDDDGKSQEVSLSELIANMGDLRGTYFPRERVAREFHLVAEQEGMQNILETFDWHFVENELGNNKVELMKRTFNSLSPAGRRVKELVKMGYDEKNIFVKPVKTPTDILFDLPGTLTTLDSLLTLAHEKVENENQLKEMDRKLLAAADRALSLRIADIYKAKGNLSSRMTRSEKLWEGYETDPIRALTGYASRIATGVAKRTTARRMLKAFTGRSLTYKQFQNKFGKDLSYGSYMTYVKQNRIHPTKQKKMYEDGRQYMQYFLAPATGAERAVGYLKAAAVLKYLGFRVMSAAVNSTSMVISVPATIAGHTGASLTQVFKSMARATKVFAAYKHNMLIAKGHKWLGRPMNIREEDFHIMNTIYGNGWAVAQFNHDAAQAMTGQVGKYANNTMQAAMYMFGKVEEMNRALTIFAAQDVLANNGLVRGDKTIKKLSTGQRLSLAKHASDRAHGIYGKAAKPWLVQKYKILDAPYTFQKYQHSYHLNMLELFGKYKSKKAVAWLALMPQVMAGTSLMSAVGYAVASLLGSDDPQEDYETLMAKFLGKGDLAKQIVSYGIIGALTGVTLKGSLETKVPIPTDLTELAGAPQSVVMDVIEAGEALYKGQYLKSLEKALPAFLGSPIKGYREKTEGLTKKNYAPTFFEGERVYATTGDFLKRAISASPIRLTEMRNKEWREDETRRAFTTRRSKISERFNQLMIEGTSGDSAKWGELFQKMNDYNDKAAVAPPHYMIPQIDLEWLSQQMKRNFAPTKYTKYPNDAE
jgi:hypothetical protein